ncbi:MAG TPA: diadenylate cyclase CdaA [Dissulfurispiraceae bacterium]|nr:diadenylate cyclase CdaA [Dissulfurispiraceae bacterium]
MLDILTQIRWQDILDILLVSIILYRVILIIKGTKAAKMLVGIGVLLVASFFSKYLQLHTMDWLVQSFWAQVVVALIVLFQPEIRRTLAKMGESSLLQGFTSAEELKSLEEIVRASIALANRKIGALIVIEREVSLKDYVEIGISLDARVTKELLLSIFHPTSPIHDGAIVIRGNRVLAAGCFLPITLGADVSKALGTRHRAGIGITEETDAVAIVVSEETGTVSVAMDGKLEAPIDMGTLREILTNLFTEAKKEKLQKKVQEPAAQAVSERDA